MPRRCRASRGAPRKVWQLLPAATRGCHCTAANHAPAPGHVGDVPLPSRSRNAGDWTSGRCRPGGRGSSPSCPPLDAGRPGRRPSHRHRAPRPGTSGTCPYHPDRVTRGIGRLVDAATAVGAAPRAAHPWTPAGQAGGHHIATARGARARRGRAPTIAIDMGQRNRTPRRSAATAVGAAPRAAHLSTPADQAGGHHTSIARHARARRRRAPTTRSRHGAGVGGSIVAGWMSAGMNWRSTRSFTSRRRSRMPAATPMSAICCISASSGVSIR